MDKTTRNILQAEAFLEFSAKESFGEFLARVNGSRNWVVSARLTENLRERGFDVAIPPKRYAAWREQWEREQFGGTLESITAAAPDMLAALKKLRPFLVTYGRGEHLQKMIELTDTAIAKAIA